MSVKNSIQHATLCFLINGNKVLLARKKRGHGEGYWNGIGGKVDKNESIENALIREVEEEVGICITAQKKVAELRFHGVPGTDKEWCVHVFTSNKWVGDPAETEEMKPRWFEKTKIPYKQMWDDDAYWIPQVMEGKKVKAEFTFNKDNKTEKYKVRIVKRL